MWGHSCLLPDHLKLGHLKNQNMQLLCSGQFFPLRQMTLMLAHVFAFPSFSLLNLLAEGESISMAKGAQMDTTAAFLSSSWDEQNPPSCMHTGFVSFSKNHSLTMSKRCCYRGFNETADTLGGGVHPCWKELPGCARNWVAPSNPPEQQQLACSAASLSPPS